MDGISVAANVAGLVSLAVQLAPHLYNYFSDVKSAQADVKRYSGEVHTFIEVCNRLHKFLSTDKLQEGFDTTQSVLVRTVVSCEGTLHDLARMLKSPVDWTRRLAWPIRKKRVDAIMEQLSRYTQLFQFSLTVEGWWVPSLTVIVGDTAKDDYQCHSVPNPRRSHNNPQTPDGYLPQNAWNRGENGGPGAVCGKLSQYG